MKKALLLAFFVAVSSPAIAQNTPSGMTPAEAKKAEAYFHFSLARVFDQQEDWDESIKEYRKALDVNPNESSVYSAMAQTYLNARNRDEAIKAAQKAIDLNPNNLGGHLILRNIYINAIQSSQNGRQGSPSAAALKDNFNKAIHELEEIVRIDPTGRDGYLQLGMLYRLNETPEKAMEIYRKYLGIEPGSEEGILALADLAMNSDNNAEAIDILNEFLKSQPNSERALEMLGDAYAALDNSAGAAEAYKRAATLNDDPELKDKLANALYDDNRLDEAGKAYEEILKNDVGNLQILQRLGLIYRRQMKYSEARTVLGNALRRSGSNSVSVKFDLALVDRDEGKLEDALKAFESILKDTEKPSYTQNEKRSRALFYTQIGILDSLMTRFDDAIAAFNNVRSLSEFSERGRIDMMIADIYRDAKNIDKAKSILQAALQDSPQESAQNRSLQMSYADLLSAQGKADEALQVLQKLAAGKEPELDLVGAMTGIYERAERFAEAQRVLDSAVKRFPEEMQVHFLQGSLYEQQKKDSEAEASFRKALALDKNNPSTLNYLGYMLADRGLKLDEALGMIKKAVDTDPINGAYLDSLGWAYFKLNKLDLAELYLKRAVIFAATNATMYDHLGDLYYKTERYQEAQAAWTKGLPYADEADEAARMRQKLEQVKTRTANR